MNTHGTWSGTDAFHVVELVAQALADLVDRPPGDLFHVERIGVEDTPGARDHVVDRDIPVGDAFARIELVHLDIDAEQIAALARDDDDAAVLGRLDQAFHTHVREIGCRQHIHHAPGVIGRIATQGAAEGLAHGAARAVAADDIAGADGLGLALTLDLARGIDALEPPRHTIGIGIRGRGDLETGKAPRIERRELGRRLAHGVEIAVVHPRLIENDVGKFRQAVFDVLHPAAAHDILGLLVVGLPERGLVDPAGLLEHALAETEGLEHLHSTAGDAVRLPAQDRAVLLFDDAGLDVAKGGKLGGERQAGRPAAHDEDIDFRRQRPGGARGGMAFGRIGDLRIARLETVEMELHETSPALAGLRP